MSTYGPSYAINQAIINNQIVSGATILASSFQQVLSDLNLSGYSMGLGIGDPAVFSAPFSPNTSIVGNIIAGYSAAVSLIGSTLTQTPSDVGGLIYLYKNLGGF